MNIKELQEIVWIAFFAALLAVSAFISLPIGAVPFTMQPFALFLGALVLGSKRATIAVFFYIFLGAIGFPFFAGGKSGLAALLGPTGGFIIGFLFVAYIAGQARFSKWFINMAILVFALAILYVFGTLWLAYIANLSLLRAFAVAAAPFILPDLIKISLAYLVFHVLKRQERLPFLVGR